MGMPALIWIGKMGGKRPAVRRKLRTRLLMTLIPTALIVLALMGYATYWASSEFITVALERTSRQHASTTAHMVELLLEQCRTSLLYAARNPLTPDSARKYLEALNVLEGLEFSEFGFIPGQGDRPFVFVSRDGLLTELSPEKIREIRPSPALFYKQASLLEDGEVWFSEFGEVELPFPTSGRPMERISGRSLRFVTPYRGPDGEDLGFVYLALDARKVRNILSLHDSNTSPVFAFPRNPRFSRFTYFFDAHGWVLFQSEAVDAAEAPLRTLDVRSTFQGTLGRPGFPEAFRPSDQSRNYWQIVEDTAKGKKGILRSIGGEQSDSPYREHFLAYAPVYFRPGAGKEPAVVGGVAFEDRSVLIELSGYKHLDVMLAISVISVLALTVAIFLVARGTTGGLLELALTVKHQNDQGRWEPVTLRETGYEAEMIKDAINALIGTIRTQSEEIRSKDLQIESVVLKEPAELYKNRFSPAIDDMFPEFIGTGRYMQQMKRDIVKASQVDVDVLIEGETGTGKQLAAEAVHRLSQRAVKPFISINCGELDEALLLDTLFGHIKGAFTDGKEDRKGAFLEADGGTLFLDEIQSASLKVQQSLLRALSLRKIKPLGSDRDISVDVRLITATNADLRRLIAEGKFREDLYYRLKVITIQTPALRHHRQNVPVLAMHFLQEGERMAGKTGLVLSRGALRALVSYSWPGNIRELKHLIITAAVMAEDNVIQAEQLGIDTVSEDSAFSGETSFFPADPESPTVAEKNSESETDAGMMEMELNRRQMLAWEYAGRNGSITSKELMDILDGSISKRTASYDIQDLVNRGLLMKVGRGPATRYVRTVQKRSA